MSWAKRKLTLTNIGEGFPEEAESSCVLVNQVPVPDRSQRTIEATSAHLLAYQCSVDWEEMFKGGKRKLRFEKFQRQGKSAGEGVSKGQKMIKISKRKSVHLKPQTWKQLEVSWQLSRINIGKM